MESREEEILFLVEPFGYLKVVLIKVIESIEIAFWASFISLIISIPLAYYSAKNYSPNKTIYYLSRSIVSGLRPFYVRNKNEMSIDPLYELENGCDTVESTDDFIRAFYDNGFNHNDMKSVIRYCQKFFTPLDASVLVNIITDRDL